MLFELLNEDIWEFLSNKKPIEISQKYFDGLKYRWGINEERVMSLKETIDKFEINDLEFIKSELDMFRRLGMTIELNSRNIKKWNKI